jgi:hypothetical protein
MTKVKLLAASVLSAALLLGAQRGAQAHCDSVDGPVAKAAIAALDGKNVNLALPYAPASAEPEIKAAFTQALKVRALGPDAKTLADRTFIETTVRLHRAGEDAPYTGLKPAGLDYGPAIPAAERALASGDLRQVKAVLAEEMEHGLTRRLEAARNGAAHTAEAKTADQVPAARERIMAELGFVTYAEGVRQVIHGATAGHEHK